MCYFKVCFSNCRFIKKCTSVLFQKGVCVVPFYRPLLHATWTWVSWRFKLTPLVKRSTPFTRSVISTELSTFGLFLNLNKLDANVLKLLYLHHISISYQFAAVCTVISTFLWYIDLMDSWVLQWKRISFMESVLPFISCEQCWCYRHQNSSQWQLEAYRNSLSQSEWQRAALMKL